jgi:hypothetical protein
MGGREKREARMDRMRERRDSRSERMNSMISRCLEREREGSGREE